MALSDDQRNQAAGHIDHVTTGADEHTEIILSATIEGDQWAAIQASPAEAEIFVAWLATHITE